MTEAEWDDLHRRPWHTIPPEVWNNIPLIAQAMGITPEMVRLACGIHSTTDETPTPGWEQEDEEERTA